jgi:acetate kinase
MATRSGSIDPSALIHLMQRHGETPESLAHILNEESGLAGLAGTGNVGDLERRAGMGDSDAQAALDIFSYRVAGAAAAMTMAAGGLDALEFTAGIGERSAMVREAVCSRLGLHDVSIDREANVAGGDRDIARPRRGVRVLVIHAREDLVAARAARVVLHNSAENY